MWIPKNRKDEITDTCSPIPTQVVSNEEYYPLPQTHDQRRVEHRINELADAYGGRLGMNRRQFLKTTGGMAVAFTAMNEVFGPYFTVQAAEATEPAAYAERWPKKEFILDIQTHHVGVSAPEPLFFRKLAAPLNKDLQGLEPKAGDLMLRNYLKEVFFDSDTTMGLISGVPSRVMRVLSTDAMIETRELLNELAGSQRMLSHGLSAPQMPGNDEEIERQVRELRIDAWKCYTGVPDADGPWFMDDKKIAYPFFEKSLELGVKNVCVHKGLPLPGSSVEYTNPRDIKKAALDFPELNFIIYHSGYRYANYELPPGEAGVGGDGYLEWTSDLVRDRRENPSMTNVYMELGTTFGHTAITHPLICGHLLGQVIDAFGADHVLWGTDSIWWGSPQWQIEAFRRFQIPDALREEFGYAAISAEDKAKIFGLNSARLLGVDVDAARKSFPDDGLSRIKAAYMHEGADPSNTQYGWVAA